MCYTLKKQLELFYAHLSSIIISSDLQYGMIICQEEKNDSWVYIYNMGVIYG